MTQFTKPGTHLEQHSMLNNFFLELQYCAVFRRESRKFAGEVWQYAKFRHFLANRVVKAGPPKNPINNFSIHTQCPPHGLRSSCAERASTTMTNAEAGMQVEHTADWFGGAWFFFAFPHCYKETHAITVSTYKQSCLCDLREKRLFDVDTPL